MPQFTSRGADVSLRSASFSATTTEGILDVRSEIVMENTQAQHDIFDRAQRLREQVVFEDEAQTSGSRWTGRHGNVPLLLIKVEPSGEQASEAERKRWRLFGAVSQRLARATTEETRSTSGSVAETPKKQDGLVVLKIGKENSRTFEGNCKLQIEKALCLTVRFTKASFERSLGSLGAKPGWLDIKIDVYCNGELASSSLASWRGRLDTGAHELTKRFSGRRSERVGEKPWILKVFKQALTKAISNRAMAQQRWNQISDQLVFEAARAFLPDGENSLLADCLEALAQLPAPEEVLEAPIQEGQMFGIIDVILTYGHGAKRTCGDSMLIEPMMMDLSRLASDGSQSAVDAQAMKDSLSSSSPNPRFHGSKETPNTPAQTSSPASSSMGHQTAAWYEMTPPRSGSVQKMPITTSTGSLARFGFPSQGGSLTTSPSDQGKGLTITKRNRTGFVTVPEHSIGKTQEQLWQELSNKATADAGFRGPLTAAGARRLSPRSLSKSAQTEASTLHSHPNASAWSSAPPASDASSHLPPLSPGSASCSLTLPSPPSQLRPTSALPAQPGLQGSKRETVRASALTPSRGRDKHRPDTRPHSDWTPGLLHDNSIISYSKDRLRTIRSEKKASFAEESIYRVIRYVIM